MGGPGGLLCTASRPGRQRSLRGEAVRCNETCADRTLNGRFLFSVKSGHTCASGNLGMAFTENTRGLFLEYTPKKVLDRGRSPPKCTSEGPDRESPSKRPCLLTGVTLTGFPPSRDLTYVTPHFVRGGLFMRSEVMCTPISNRKFQ